jgi:hypothetical protein
MSIVNLLWHDRMKSARRKKRLQKEDLEKKLIVLNKEYKQLIVQIRNLGYKPLIPPVQKGWKRFFVLREDVRRSPRAEFFEVLLKKINTEQFSDKKQFKVRQRKRGKKIYVDRIQELQSFSEYGLRELKLSDAQAFYFTETLVMNQRREWCKEFVFNEPWRFVQKIVPNMITLLQIKDPLLEQRESEISYYLDNTIRRGKLNKLIGCRKYKAYKIVEKYPDPLLNKPLYDIISEYYKE